MKKNIKKAFLLPLLITSIVFSILCSSLCGVLFYRFYHQQKLQYENMLLGQTVRKCQDRMTNAFQIMDRIGNNPEFSYHMCSDRTVSSRDWITDIMTSYNVDNSAIEQLLFFSEKKRLSATLIPAATYDELSGLEAVRQAEPGKVVLISSEDRKLSTMLGYEDSRMILLESVVMENGSPAFVLGVLEVDPFRGLLPVNMTVEMVDNASEKRQYAADKANGVISAEDGNFRYLLRQDDFPDKHLQKALFAFCSSFAGCLILSFAGAVVYYRRIQKPIAKLKDVAQDYDPFQRKERYNYRSWLNRKKSLKQTTFEAVILCMVAPIMLQCAANYCVVGKLADGFLSESSSEQANYIYNAVNERFSSKLSAMQGIGYDSRMQQALKTRDSAAIEEVVADYGILYNQSDSVTIYGPYMELVYASDRLDPVLLSQAELSSIKAKLGVDTWYMNCSIDEYDGRICIYNWIRDIITGNVLGVIQGEINTAKLNSCWAESTADVIELSDSTGRVIVSGSMSGEKENSNGFSIRMELRPWKQTIQEEQWNLRIHYSFENRQVFVSSVLSTLLGYLLLLILIAIILAQRISDQLSKPLSRLETVSQKMFAQSSGERTLWKLPEDLPITEYSELSQSFNQVAERTEKLIDQVMVLTKKEAELKLQKDSINAYALQAQINPHFLYNTLESISCVVSMNRNEDAKEMIGLLAKLFRYSIKQGEPYVTLGEEIEKLGEYVKLINIRLNGGLLLETDIPERFLSKRVLRFSLQPIVENSVAHGMTNGNCHVLIKATEDNQEFVLSIQDDGIGIEPEKLSEIERMLTEGSQHRNIGLCNVNSRLKMVFGENFGLMVQSEQGNGTTVTIRMPSAAQNMERER